MSGKVLNFSQYVNRFEFLVYRKSTLRKLHDNIADPKYDGVKVSRTQLLEEDDGHSFRSSGEEEEQNDESGEEIRQEETVHRPSDEGAAASEDSKEDEAEMIVTEDRSAAVDITLALRKTQDEDRKKGLAVSRQIARINCLPAMSCSDGPSGYLGLLIGCTDSDSKIYIFFKYITLGNSHHSLLAP